MATILMASDPVDGEDGGSREGVYGGRRRPTESDTADGDRHRLRRLRSVDAGRH